MNLSWKDILGLSVVVGGLMIILKPVKVKTTDIVIVDNCKVDIHFNNKENN